jgi:hypothetical protein
MCVNLSAYRGVCISQEVVTYQTVDLRGIACFPESGSTGSYTEGTGRNGTCPAPGEG